MPGRGASGGLAGASTLKIKSTQDPPHDGPCERGFQADRGRLSYIQPRTCALPQRLSDDAVSPSTIRLKWASTIAEIRKPGSAGTVRLLSNPARRTDKAIRPAQLLQVRQASLFAGEPVQKTRSSCVGSLCLQPQMRYAGYSSSYGSRTGAKRIPLIFIQSFVQAIFMTDDQPRLKTARCSSALTPALSRTRERGQNAPFHPLSPWERVGVRVGQHRPARQAFNCFWQLIPGRSRIGQPAFSR